MTYHLLPGALCATAIAFVLPGIASAAPIDNTWDIEEYDNCIQNTTKPQWQCCIDSGGVPTLPSDPNGCTAPPAEGQGSQQGPRGLPSGPVTGDLPEVQGDPGQPPRTPLPTPIVPIGPAIG
ncbi:MULTISPECIES: hypothetical protein [unclassified Mycobacterium]|uniref:hypothetical protein n=1 Tax=unclassified Mycobacterium TaxID=2642494 RepID=UPI0007400622|nr:MULTISPECIES: hypothetical protein [unclassified Mycobacterium]KUH87518.1 hypothetical protein AU186_02690 [Mycobacterium sp. GA-1999]KUH90307.1 hypothetical protein AU187_22510 [Mycobacterium sp. IS-1556]KUH90793.1 hypothetical protein AU185_03595 [Mycobacterium sp. GA-0227b]